MGFSAVYFASDVLELVQGGFSPFQLLLTYVAEAAVPLFVLGLYAVQRPQIGRAGVVGAVGYAYTFIYFTGTVLVALVNRPSDWTVLKDQLAPWVIVHGILMMVFGVLFGWAVNRAGVLPRWTGTCLALGVVAVAASSELPETVQLLAAAVRDVAFGAMGAYVLIAAWSQREDLHHAGPPSGRQAGRSTLPSPQATTEA